MQRHINLAVGSHRIDISLHTVACVQIAEHLVFIDKSGIAVVDYHLESHFGLLPHQQVHLLSVIVERMALGKVAFHLGRSHDAIALLVDMHMHNIAFALLHTLLLLAEGAEEVLHQSPVEECSVLVDPRDFQISEVADLTKRVLSSSDGTLFLVEVYEHFKFVAWFCTLRYITFGQ